MIVGLWLLFKWRLWRTRLAGMTWQRYYSGISLFSLPSLAEWSWFSAALSVKMSILLYLPGLLVFLFKRHGLLHTLRHSSTIVLFQVLIALPFLRKHSWPYLSSAFEFSRVFLYKWTVNWRFISEDVFLSHSWALTLLAGQLFTLIAFAMIKWCRNDGGVMSVLNRGLRRPMVGASVKGVSADGV
jgi:alpha-1,3-mannosyltransferase